MNELPSKCIFGVDMPYGDLELSLETVKKPLNGSKIADVVLGENIVTLLGL